jgi:hypothetical protein
VEPGHYYRFNVGVRVAKKGTEKLIKPRPSNKRFDQQQPKNIDWAQVSIDLDDYKGMDSFVQLTREYLKGEAPRLTACAAKLLPRRSSA